jgi:hypothetical protein
MTRARRICLLKLQRTRACTAKILRQYTCKADPYLACSYAETKEMSNDDQIYSLGDDTIGKEKKKKCNFGWRAKTAFFLMSMAMTREEMSMELKHEEMSMHILLD